MHAFRNVGSYNCPWFINRYPTKTRKNDICFFFLYRKGLSDKLWKSFKFIFSWRC